MDADEINDSVFDADPYFLLMGEADAAIAEKSGRKLPPACATRSP